MPALLLTLLVGQSANIGTLLAFRGQWTFIGWDGAKKAEPKIGDLVALSDELSTEADGMLELSVADGSGLIVLGGSTKVVIEKVEAGKLSMRVEYGRARIQLVGRLQASLAVERGMLLLDAGDFVFIKEAGHVQLVAVNGRAEIVVGAKQAFIGSGDVIEPGQMAYRMNPGSLSALTRSLELDPTPIGGIAQALEADLPGFIGPKSGHIRWLGPAESFGDGMHLAPPFEQSPAGAPRTAP